jgi:hypothetical protein
MNDRIAELQDFVPAFLSKLRERSLPRGDACTLLHGSTTMGIDDAHSDLDVWLLLPTRGVEQFEAAGAPRFIEFQLSGKPGHFTIEPAEAFFDRVRRCDFPLIAELRLAQILSDADGVGHRLVDTARQPMRDAVRRAWFRYHYVEMRGEHRACDTPIERNTPVPILLAMSSTIAQALRAACVLDGVPYPYVKWLHRVASQTPTGAKLALHVERMLELLAADSLRQPGPERQYPLSQKLRDIRAVLIDTARAAGIDEPWLREWYLTIPASRAGIVGLEW